MPYPRRANPEDTGKAIQGQGVIRALSEYFRVPEELVSPVATYDLAGEVGFFRFGPNAICYGSCSTGVSKKIQDAPLHDPFSNINESVGQVCLPFEAAQVIDNLRHERYMKALTPEIERVIAREWVHKIYYFIRPLLPVWIRRYLQRAYFSDWHKRQFPAWPVDCTVDTLHQQLLLLSMSAAGQHRVPFIWFWPDGAPSCLIMTHDVETRAGRDFTSLLMDIDESYGFKASFQVVPEKRYELPDEYVREIRGRGFEFNIHDLNHDGNLYRDREEFLRRAKKINAYAKQYDARGFRAGALYRNPEWYGAFEFSYDMSLPNVAHLEPQRGGCCTVMPFFIGKILELPLTTTEDYSILHILCDESIDLWKQQFELITANHGLASFIAHPDYLIDARARNLYKTLLNYLRERVEYMRIWKALPGEVDCWWRARSQMRLVSRGDDWEIEGPQKERARVAFAVLDGPHLRYETAGNSAVKGGGS